MILRSRQRMRPLQPPINRLATQTTHPAITLKHSQRIDLLVIHTMTLSTPTMSITTHILARTVIATVFATMTRNRQRIPTAGTRQSISHPALIPSLQPTLRGTKLLIGKLTSLAHRTRKILSTPNAQSHPARRIPKPRSSSPTPNRAIPAYRPTPGAAVKARTTMRTFNIDRSIPNGINASRATTKTPLTRPSTPLRNRQNTATTHAKAHQTPPKVKECLKKSG